MDKYKFVREITFSVCLFDDAVTLTFTQGHKIGTKV